MAYTINLTDGTIFATVADGTIDTTSSLTLVGKNYAGYGEFLNENYIKLLESGANTSQPSAPLSGQLWYDKSNNLLKVYNGSVFKNLGSATSSASEPSSNVAGDLWFDSTNQQLKVYTGSAFILVGPSFTAGTGTSGAVVATVTDNTAVDHVVVQLFVEDSIVATVSKDSTFTPSASVSGFSTIGPGIQLSSAVSNAVFKGDATNAQTLDSLDSTDFLSAVANDTTSGTLGVLNDTGLTVGADSDASISVSTNDVIFKNATSDGDIKIQVNDGGVNTTVVNFDGATASMNPGSNNAIDMGTTALQYKEIHAVSFKGESTSSQYADLAERFESDMDMDPGTVVQLGGSAEVTQCSEDLSEAVLGVVSTNPGFLMNDADKNDPAIAMSGKCPVKVTGTVSKGDRLVSAGSGLARKAQSGEANSFNVIGRALENKTTAGEGTVLAIVRVSH